MKTMFGWACMLIGFVLLFKNADLGVKLCILGALLGIADDVSDIRSELEDRKPPTLPGTR